MAIYIGRVESIADAYAGDRIQASIPSIDKGKLIYPNGDDRNVDSSDVRRYIPFSFPLLPKMVHVKPKVGEIVLIFTFDDNNPDAQRFYVGPIISQPQYLNKDDATMGASNLLSGSLSIPLSSVDNNADVTGSFAKDDEIAIYGRQKSDIILSNDDIRIRCGARLVNEYKSNDISFNKNNPGFIKIKYHKSGLKNPAMPSDTIENSTATIVADNINLITHCGTPYFPLTNSDEQITDETMQDIINKAHSLPYGDVLVDFLLKFLAMFKNHTHKYHNLTPCPDTYSNIFDEAYGYQNAKSNGNGAYTQTASGRIIEDVSQTFKGLGDKLLSKHVRIN